MATIDLTRLKSQLASAKVRETDFALFEVINKLIDFLRSDLSNIDAVANEAGGGVGALLIQTYLTATDETGLLINSRELIAGDNVTFDDSIPGERTIDVDVPSETTDHVVLADGGNNPTLGVGDGAGGFIYTPYTP